MPDVISTTRPASSLVLCGELLDEQERRAHVLVQECVELLGCQLAETPTPAARVVDDEDVERAECSARSRDDACRRVRVGEVRLEVLHAELACDGLGAVGLGVPLLDIVLRPALNEDMRARLLQSLHDCEPDARPPADPCDERIPARQVHRPSLTWRPSRSGTCSAQQ